MAVDLWRTRPNTYTSPLTQAFDRMLEQAFAPYSSTGTANGGSTGYQSLPVNIWETDDGYSAALLAPGLEEQSISVTVHDDTLAVEGELKFQAPQGAQVVWQEFAPVKFRRSLRLGSAVDPQRVEASYNNGVLLVSMPKAEHARPRQVQVQMGEASGTKKLKSA
ncbi:MAG: Hsp20/alpha crystallin family protein [Chloroflexi bacterium]|nr:Hsp20/alpha crystallin family protein [Chloroflexota bacterium]MBV9598511.1 Hsp20/alpha crystallin family protein [Chloroflexota bacterium]